MKSTRKETRVWVTPKLNLFKIVAAGCGLLLLLPAARAQFTWPVYEPFGQYTNDTRLGANADTMASNFWYVGNSATASNPRVWDYAALSYPAFVADTNPTPKGAVSSSATGSRDAAAPFTSHSGTIYVSFVISNIFNNATTFDRMFFSLNTGSSASSGFGMSAYFTTDYRLRIRKNASNGGAFSSPTPVLTTNATHLVVMRYLQVPGDNDKVDLWLDPTPFGDSGSIPPPTISTTNGPNVSAFRLLALTSRGTGLYTYDIDEIRLGDTWDSVTPLATPAPGPMFAVSGGGIGCLGDSFPIDLSGSVTTNSYLLYTNAVYAEVTLAGNGSVLNFGPQNTIGYYSILASNNVTGDLGWMSNSPIIYVRALVTLVASPAPVITAINNRAQFNVSCTGDELSYRWYKDGSALTDDSHITGSGTNTLVVWPATTADIGSYYCVITNPCSVSPTVSGSATLTLAEPNNLTWVGDAFNVNIWDLATSVEWTPGSGVFNPGDNVTFDDTYTYSSPVTLVGVLTPTAINVNATRDYTWAGVGTIAGSASLVKSGAGALTLNNNTANGYSNSYAGGTVINAGTVNITNGWFNLGTGRVTLAGGTLESWNKGDGSTNLAGGLRNDLYVTANSTWQIDRTGDQCAGLVGALFGNTGTTLNLYNSSTIQNSANRMRFGGVFTNDSAIAVSANSVTTNSPMDIGTYNSTGVQVYNGPISGTNTGFMVSGAGSVYLNGANTYTRDTTNAAGFLAGSGSISSLLGVGPGATLGGGSQAAIGTFTINSNVILNGNVRIRVDKSLAQSNDLVSVSGTITNGGTGTVTVTNIGATTLAAGDRFRIFSGPVSNGAALAVTGGAVGWVNDLATDGSIQVGGVIADYTTNISYSVGGATLSITWPQTHLGWILQSQTNALTTGINPAGTWYDIPSTANVTSSDIPVISANPTVFYRLRHP